MMHAMTEAEFMREIGIREHPGIVLPALGTFLRSHGFHDVAAVADRQEDKFGDIGEDDYETGDDSLPADEAPVSDGGGI